MAQTNYKYDVAFSFLAQDESLAAEINDLLQDRLATFLYSRKQGELAGADGEQRFNAVFGEESRVVVVLYRKDWGHTPWTRIEQTAIRNRAFEEGYDFVKFIPLDDEPAVPKWLPRTQLWIGLTRWGIAAAASVIEARVQELGGVPREESVTDRAARLEREMNAAKARREFLNSEAGVKAACDEFAALAPALKALASEIQSRAPSISIGLRESPNYLLVHGLQHAVGVAWKGRYANTLDGAALTLTLWDSHPPFPGFVVFEKPAALHGTKFSFDVLPDGRVCWRADNEPSRFYTTTDLAAFILKHYMDHQPNDPQR